MKKILFFIAILAAYRDYAQCRFIIDLYSSGGNCLGSSTLKVATANPLSKIVWYNSTSVVSTVTATPGSTSGITVAGGNGRGSGANQLYPDGLFVDSIGNIYVVDVDNARIQKWAPGATGGITVAGGNGTGSAPNQLNFPIGLHVDRGGNMYIADAINDRIQKWAPGATSGITVAGGNGRGSASNQFNDPDQVAVDVSGNVYVADNYNFRVQKWAPGATSGVTVAGGNGSGPAANQLSDVYGFFVDGSENIYFSEAYNNRVSKWAPGSTSGVTVAGGNGGGSAPNQLYGPLGLYVDASGNIYVCDFSNNRVQKWLPGATSGITVAGGNGSGSAANQFNGPEGIYLDGNDNIYVSDDYNYRIQKWTQPSINKTYIPTTAGNYTAVVTSDDGCSLTSKPVTIIAIVTPSISINASATNISSCTPVTFTAFPVNGGVTPSYQWQLNGSNVGSNDSIYINSSVANGDVIKCVMSSSLACTTTAAANSNSISMTAKTAVIPTVSIMSSNPTICSGDPVSFTAAVTNAGTNPSYKWQLNGIKVGSNSSTFTNNIFSNGDVVTCTVLSSDAASCAPVVSNNIIVNVKATPSLPPDQTFSISQGQSIVLDPVITGNIVSYLWSPVTGLSDNMIKNPVANPSNTMIYKLQLTSADGCKALGDIIVKVFSQVRIPNAFTPNGDGKNDKFYVHGGPGGSRIKDFSIFNRWGQKIFQVHDIMPDDPNFGWNGNYNGIPVPDGAYVYVITLSLSNGGQQLFQGTVVLIR